MGLFLLKEKKRRQVLTHWCFSQRPLRYQQPVSYKAKKGHTVSQGDHGDRFLNHLTQRLLPPEPLGGGGLAIGDLATLAVGSVRVGAALFNRWSANLGGNSRAADAAFIHSSLLTLSHVDLQNLCHSSKKTGGKLLD